MGLLRMATRTAVVAGRPPPSPGAWRAVRTPSGTEEDAQQYAQQAQPPPPPPPEDDATAQLQELAQLHAQGVLTDEEFAAAKAKTSESDRTRAGM